MSLVELADLVFKLSAIIISVSTAIYTFIATRRKDVDKELAKRAKASDENRRLIDECKAAIAAAPGKDDVHNLVVAVTKLEGVISTVSVQVAGQKELLQRVENTVGIQQESLMKRGKS